MRAEADVLTPEREGRGGGARSPVPPPLRPPGGLPVPGARAIDHTADIGLELEAPHLPALFERAAFAAVWMALEAPVPPAATRRALCLSAGDLPSLLRRWLQEILYWQEVDGLAPSEFGPVVVEAGGPGPAAVEATVALGQIEERPVREIKGVTYHGLTTGRRGGGWFARVVFDV